MKIRSIVIFFIGIIKSIPFNIKLFPLKVALKLPILVSPFVKIKSLKGTIMIKDCNLKMGMIKIGFGNIGIFDQIFSRSILEIDGKIIFYGKTSIGHGSKISVGKNGVLEIGKNFDITAETAIICHNNIKFGDNNLISWENLFMDIDFHKIKNIENDIINEPKEILIGNNVWIGCRNTILKGTKIQNNSVIGADSLINKEFEKENVLIVGNPAKIVKENIVWEK